MSVTESKSKNVDELVNDFTSSEREYVNTLKFLIEEFWNPLRKQEDVHQSEMNLESSSSSFFGHAEHLRIVFGSLDAIYTVNNQLLHHLESMKDKNESQRSIQKNGADVVHDTSISEDEKATRDFFFATFDSHSIGSLFLCLIPMLKMYVTYVTNYQEAVRILHSAQYQSDLLFQSLVANCVSKSPDFALETYLAQPLGRISLYESFIKEFLNVLPETSHADLNMALVRLSGVSGYLDLKMKEVENIQKLTAVQKLIKGLDESLVIPSRRYIREGELELIAGIHKDIFTRFKRHAFLFNDSLFVTKSEKKRSFGKKSIRPYSINGVPPPNQQQPVPATSLTPAQATSGRRFSLSGIASSLSSTFSQTFNRHKQHQHTATASKAPSNEIQNSEPTYDFILKIDFNEVTSLQQLDVKNHLDSLKQDCFVIAVTYIFDDDVQEQETLFLGFETKTESDDWFECVSQNVETTKQQTEFYQREAKKIAALKAEQARAILGQQYLNYRIHGPNPTGFPTNLSPQSESPPSETLDSSNDNVVAMAEIPEIGKGSLRQKRTSAKTVFKMSSSERIHNAELAQNNYHTLLEKQQEIEKYNTQQRALKFDRMKQKYLTMPQLTRESDSNENDGSSSRSKRLERAKEKPKYGTMIVRSKTRDTALIRNSSVQDVPVTDGSNQNNNNQLDDLSPTWEVGVGPSLVIPLTPARKEFAELLADPVGFECFSQFLKEHLAQENLAFLLDIQDLQNSPDDEVVVKGERIYRRYIKSSKLNLAYSIKEIVVTFFNQPRSRRTPEAVKQVFRSSQEAVIELLRLDNYRRFLKSGYYPEFVRDRQTF